MIAFLHFSTKRLDELCSEVLPIGNESREPIDLPEQCCCGLCDDIPTDCRCAECQAVRNEKSFLED